MHAGAGNMATMLKVMPQSAVQFAVGSQTPMQPSCSVLVDLDARQHTEPHKQPHLCSAGRPWHDHWPCCTVCAHDIAGTGLHDAVSCYARLHACDGLENELGWLCRSMTPARTSCTLRWVCSPCHQFMQLASVQLLAITYSWSAAIEKAY